MTDRDKSRALRLDKLSLANFRGFKQLDIKFEDDITLIAGINGVGKSSLLYALRVLLGDILPKLTPARQADLHFSARDVHLHAPPPPEDRGMDAVLRLKDGYHRPSIHLDLIAYINKDEPWRDHTSFNLDEMDKETGPNHSLAVYFGPTRSLMGMQPRKIAEPKSPPVSLAYKNAVQERQTILKEFIDWLHAQQRQGATARDGSRHRVLKALQDAMVMLLPDFRNLRLEQNPGPRLMVDKNGAPFSLSQLSDGERGMLALIFDIARRLTLANPERANPLRDGGGIVLIDEIELHMHPQWQRKVLGRLRKIFPNCQFVITTHSPVVFGEVEARCIRHLYQEDGKVKVYTPTAALGREVSRILEEDMGTPIRNAEAAVELRELFGLIDKDELQKASKRIEELEAQWGGNEPELVRARALITFLEDD